ncbi:hypothetical protein PIROE2DRAFT_10244 [Piromyces sp. E2]|nr:hypothetical protein PIROE2DRAFT_10244 [Piromyces sp. E2]|eukprot:OUM63276.1 hypothetical protein PIROE2DRAFT_10244 [Piromyces sp. E2]
MKKKKNSTNIKDQTSNIKQQRQKAIATLRKRVEKNSPIESPPPGLSTNLFPSNNPMQNLDQSLFERANNAANIPLMTMSNNNGIFEKEYTFNTLPQNSNQPYMINNGNPAFMDSNNAVVQQNLMTSSSSSPLGSNNDIKSKLDTKNPLAILSRRVEKSKMDHQEKNKMEMLDQRKQSLQILENRTNERMYNNNGNINTNDKAFEFFQQHKNNVMYASPNYSPSLNNAVGNGFQNPTLYPNQINVERNDSFSSNSSLTRDGSGEIPTSPYDQYSSYSRVSSVDSSRISSLMLPEANNMARYPSLSSSSRFGSNSYMDDSQLFSTEYKSFSSQLYYQQQQSLSNSSKSIIPSQRVPAQRVSSLSYSPDDFPQLGVIGSTVNKKSSLSSSNTINSPTIAPTANILSSSSANPPPSAEPEQNIRQHAINTLLRRVKHNDGSTSPTNTSPSPPQRVNSDNLYNGSNTNYGSNPYGTLEHYGKSYFLLI